MQICLIYFLFPTDSVRKQILGVHCYYIFLLDNLCWITRFKNHWLRKDAGQAAFLRAVDKRNSIMLEIRTYSFHTTLIGPQRPQFEELVNTISESTGYKHRTIYTYIFKKFYQLSKNIEPHLNNKQLECRNKLSGKQFSKAVVCFSKIASSYLGAYILFL